MTTKEDLQLKARNLANEIRQWSIMQTSLWQQLPNLALECDGRTGFSDKFQFCYELGFWRLWSSGDDLMVSVDCATGRIIHEGISSTTNVLTDANDEYILRLAPYLDRLDAASIIGQLSDEAQRDRPSYYTADEWAEHEQRRAEVRERCKLAYGKPYVRSVRVATTA